MNRKGSNSVQVRRYNERVVLEVLQRLGQASKADIARLTHLTPQAVAGMVDALVDAGLVEQRGRRTGQIGQPSVLYGPAADGAYSIGLQVGRHALDAVLVDFAGAVHRFESSEYDYPDPSNISRLSSSYVDTLRASLSSSARERLIGVGVAIPFFLDEWASELRFPEPIAKAWRSIDPRRELFTSIEHRLWFENDASAAATAELVYGRGREYKNWIYLSVNTFVGGGLIINGNLEVGPNGNSAAYGPFPVSASRLSSVPAPERSFEILLHRASVYVLLDHLRANGVPVKRAQDVEKLPDECMAFVSEWIDDAAEALAEAIIGSIAVVDVEAIVIDAILPRKLLEMLVARVQRFFTTLVPNGLVAPSIVVGAIGRRAAAIGGAILPFYEVFAPASRVLVKSVVSE